MVHKSLRSIKNHWELAQNHFRVVHESPRITSESFQTSLWITENCPQNHFRVVCQSPRITSESFVVCKSPRITQESFQSGSQITKNHPRIIYELFANHPRIISEWFTNHWESPQNHFRHVNESLRTAPETFQSSSGITKNQIRIISEWFANYRESHKNNKVLSCQWSIAKWHICLNITVFVVTLSDSTKPDNFPAVLADSNKDDCEKPNDRFLPPIYRYSIKLILQ